MTQLKTSRLVDLPRKRAEGGEPRRESLVDTYIVPERRPALPAGISPWFSRYPLFIPRIVCPAFPGLFERLLDSPIALAGPTPHHTNNRLNPHTPPCGSTSRYADADNAAGMASSRGSDSLARARCVELARLLTEWLPTEAALCPLRAGQGY